MLAQSPAANEVQRLRKPAPLVSPVTHIEPFASKRLLRRGATSLEYLFVISLILVVCIAGVQHVGGYLKKSTTDTAATLQKNNPAR